MRKNKKKYLIHLLLCLTFVLCGCNIVEEKPQQNAQQLQCEHEYVEIGWDINSCDDGSATTVDIYCPKCQWETTVSYREWNRIQADIEYRNNK